MNVDEVRGLSALQGYDEAELKALLAVSTERVFRPGERLCEEGKPGQSCFIVVRGEVEVLKRAVEETGGETALATLPAGTLLGQMALADKGPRSASVRAKTEIIALEIARDTFNRLLSQHSAFAIRFHEQLVLSSIRQLRRATDRLLGIVIDRQERDKEKARMPALTPRLKQRTARVAPPSPDRAEISRLRAATTEWSLPIGPIDLARPQGAARAAEARARSRPSDD